MADLPKISIITPSFNQAGFIEQTICSVLDQRYPNLEYIVMDGGSTDGTLDILRRYEGHLKWTSEPDRGQSHAINKGLRLATGDVIGYLNSDDLYEPGALLEIEKFLQEHPGARWFSGKCRFIDSRGTEIRKFVTLYKNFWLYLSSYTALKVLDFISQPATFWHREVIDKIGDFDENLYYTMDYDYSLRVGRYYKLWTLSHTLASYRIHNSSKTFASAVSVKAQFDEDLATARRNGIDQPLISMHAFHNHLITFVYYRLVQASS